MLRLLTILLAVQSGFAADLVFSGNLARVGHESLSLKLADGRVIYARIPQNSTLSSESIAGQYKMGDEIEIACSGIPQVWDEETGRYDFIEINRIKFLSEATSEQLRNLLASQRGRNRNNLLTPPNPASPAPRDLPATEIAPEMDKEAHARLERAREINLDRVAHLPNFVADEIGKRFQAGSEASKWRAADTIQSEISFKGDEGSRQQIRRDGRKWDKPFQALPGFKWSGGFGAEIKPLFDLECPTAVDYDGPAEIAGKSVFKYRFSSSADGCFVSFFLEHQSYNPARAGFFYIDDSGNVIRVEEDALAFPVPMEFAQRAENVTWDNVKIGDQWHLLPVSASFIVSFVNGSRWRIEVEYKNHRHFEAASSVTFH